MPDKLINKFIFFAVIIYLPLSIFFIFWLYLVTLVYTPDAFQYQVFYGQDGNNALLWLFGVLLPALFFLLLRARGKVLLRRGFGAAGFYCLLGSLISSYWFLVLPGFVFLFISIVISRQLKKHRAEQRQ